MILEQIPFLIFALFGATLIASISMIYLASRSKTLLLFASVWIILQSTLTLLGIYQQTELMPPRIMLYGIFPAILIIAFSLLLKQNQEFINSFNLKTLTYLHIIRLPVEICLALLYHYETMSIYVTYDGTNFDIISGISAPIIALICFKKDRVQKKTLLIWNIICMLLLINVVVTAILSTPSPLQQLAFDQPNTAILYFPFSLLPTMIVPIVLFAHLVAIKKITK